MRFPSLHAGFNTNRTFIIFLWHALKIACGPEATITNMMKPVQLISRLAESCIIRISNVLRKFTRCKTVKSYFILCYLSIWWNFFRRIHIHWTCLKSTAFTNTNICMACMYLFAWQLSRGDDRENQQTDTMLCVTRLATWFRRFRHRM